MDSRKPFYTKDFVQSLDVAAAGLADSITGALGDAVTEAVTDPLVLTMMAADRVDPVAFEALLRKMATKLPKMDPATRRLCSC